MTINSLSVQPAYIYNWMLREVKHRLVLELRDAFSRHPVYKKVWISTRYPLLRENEKHVLIVRGASAGHQNLHPAHFMGTLKSHVALARVRSSSSGKDNIVVDNPNHSIEWVREDTMNLHNLVLGGIYYVKIVKVEQWEDDSTWQSPAGDDREAYFVKQATFYVDQVFEELNDILIKDWKKGDPDIFELKNCPIPETLKVFMGQFLLVKGNDYLWSPGTKTIQILNPARRAIYRASYNYDGESFGPFQVCENEFHSTAIPGVILAFGNRITEGDKQAVIVTENRELGAYVWGGFWDMSIEFEVKAQDTIQEAEIADYAAFILVAEKKRRLELFNIWIREPSIGGESEDMEDEGSQSFNYKASISVPLYTTWEYREAIPLRVREVGFEGSIFIGQVEVEAHPLPYRNKNFDKYSRIVG